MAVTINTKNGAVEIENDVLSTVVGASTTEIFGVVGMTSKSAVKDSFKVILGQENYSKGVVISNKEEGITVDVYVVVSYGVKINEVAKNIQERVKFNLENQLGIVADSVNIFVQDVKVVSE
ncbi:Asp23/Gls24 family envelope stress response protein [Streptococcaceae bacterium ESL0687]|nr:Asp23/Gls24 family envelope stress response protein [Streptococcaceae bacterium ESL0687]